MVVGTVVLADMVVVQLEGLEPKPTAQTKLNYPYPAAREPAYPLYTPAPVSPRSLLPLRSSVHTHACRRRKTFTWESLYGHAFARCERCVAVFACM